jgi:hypothetical protein
VGKGGGGEGITTINMGRGKGDTWIRSLRCVMHHPSWGEGGGGEGVQTWNRRVRGVTNEGGCAPASLDREQSWKKTSSLAGRLIGAKSRRAHAAASRHDGRFGAAGSGTPKMRVKFAIPSAGR